MAGVLADTPHGAEHANWPTRAGGCYRAGRKMSGSMQRPLALTLLRHGDTITVDVADTATLIPRGETRVDDAFLRDVAAEMAAVAQHHGGDRTEALARIGRIVFTHLLTETARERLRDAPGGDLHLRLDEQLIHVPWEICHDGLGFLATKFRIARQVITGQTLAARSASPGAAERLRVLVIADPTETLPHAASEAEQLCDYLGEIGGVDLTLLAGRAVRRLPLLAALETHDIVHFAGHSDYLADDPSRSSWRLADGVLTALDLSRLRPAPRLVFSNSCEGAADGPWTPTYNGQVFGLGSAFLLAGVANYVGTLWVVKDSDSIDFATTCYRHLAAGGRLGDALFAARAGLSERSGEGATSWASYVHYGDPGFRPFPAGIAPAGVSAPRAARGQPAHRAAPLGDAGDSSPPERPPPLVVGRGDEISALETALSAARAGGAQVVFVSGPAGIGKTALLDAFLARTGTRDGVWISRGGAVEQYGAGEPYLPLLTALGSLGRSPQGRPFVDAMRRVAPSWLAELPSLRDDGEAKAPAAANSSTSSRERMLRQLGDLIEVATKDRPLVVILEDLHWSDHSTIEAVAYLARRRSLARLLLIGTYRPMEATGPDHPLRAVTLELAASRASREVPLGSLDAGGIDAYLRERFSGATIDADVTALVQARTEGHPLFVVNLVDFAEREGFLRVQEGHLALTGRKGRLESSIPDGLRPVVERQVERLTPVERRALEAASVAGIEFSASAVAAALGEDLESIDTCCEALARRGQFLRATGLDEASDGVPAGRYRFLHSLYPDVVRQRIGAARLARLHRAIGLHLEATLAERAAAHAAQLAAHFARAHDHDRALRYHEIAASKALERHAAREATAHFEAALQALEQRPSSAVRATRELGLVLSIATLRMATHGWGARETEAAFAKARMLCDASPACSRANPVLRGLLSFRQVRAELGEAHELGEILLQRARSPGADRALRVQASYGHGVTLFHTGMLEGARDRFEAALAEYDPADHADHMREYGGYDAGVACSMWLGLTLALMGRLDDGARWGRDGLALAQRIGDPFSLSWAHYAACVERQIFGDWAGSEPPAVEAVRMAEEYGYPHTLAIATASLGWARVMQGNSGAGIPLVRQGIAAVEATGASLVRPQYLSMLAAVDALEGNLPAAAAKIDEALALMERTGELWHEVHLRIAKSRFVDDQAAAEACLQRAYDVACTQGARLLELRAAVALGRCWRARGEGERAEALVAQSLAWFDPAGTSTPEIRSARKLLGELARRP